MTRALGWAVCLVLAACGDDDASSPDAASPMSEGATPTPTPSPTPPPPTPSPTPTPTPTPTPPGPPPPPGTGTAADFAARLGRTHFLIGMGNDLAGEEHGYDHDFDGAYTLPVTLDLHYCYLVGLPGMGGWPDWNADGSFVNIMTDTADAHGVVPMFTVYMMASWGDGNLAGLADAGFMDAYWDATELLFQRLAMFGRPAVVHVEPDFWGYAQQMSGGDPSSVEVRVNTAPGCADLPNDLSGFGRCWARMARAIAPMSLIGFHASRWAGAPADMIAFLTGAGATDTDFIGMDPLDRDAGCFEAHVDPQCQRNDGPWYWDETNTTSPNFHEYLAFSRQISEGLGRPILWWQIPFGVPSDTPGGTAGRYRDNRVRYFFAHIDELVAAGGVAAAFGTGAGNQTYITTDDGQFERAVTGYYAAPVALP